MPGITRSITTTSGSSHGDHGQAASPLAASPTTSRSSKADRHELTPSRSRSWSSTTMHAVIASAHRDRSFVVCRLRTSSVPWPGRGAQGEIGGDGLRPLAHDRQPEVPRRHAVDVEAAPVVGHAQHHGAGAVSVVRLALLQRDRHGAGGRVAGHVGERLLGDAVQHRPVRSARARTGWSWAVTCIRLRHSIAAISWSISSCSSISASSCGPQLEQQGAHLRLSAAGELAQPLDAAVQLGVRVDLAEQATRP